MIRKIKREASYQFLCGVSPFNSMIGHTISYVSAVFAFVVYPFICPILGNLRGNFNLDNCDASRTNK